VWHITLYHNWIASRNTVRTAWSAQPITRLVANGNVVKLASSSAAEPSGAERSGAEHRQRSMRCMKSSDDLRSIGNERSDRLMTLSRIWGCKLYYGSGGCNGCGGKQSTKRFPSSSPDPHKDAAAPAAVAADNFAECCTRCPGDEITFSKCLPYLDICNTLCC